MPVRAAQVELAKAVPVMVTRTLRSGLRGSGTASSLQRPSRARASGASRSRRRDDERFTTWDDAALSAVATLAVGVLLGAGGVSIRYRRGLTLR